MWGRRRIAWGCWHNSCWPFGGEVWGCLRPPGCSAPTPGLLSPRAQARLGVKKAFSEGRWQRCHFSLGRLLPGSQLGIASGAPPRPPALGPQTFGFCQQLGGAKTWGFGRGWRQGAGGSAGRRASPRTGTPPQGRSQPQGTHRKHWRGGWGHWVRLRSWQRACVCAHTCERAARGPTGTSPRPPPAFLGAAVPASEGGAQPKPLGEPPPPPNQSALPWELKTCLFQDILLRMLYKCLRYAYNN